MNLPYQKIEWVDSEIEKLISIKLLVAVDILEEICKKKHEIKKLKNHPINEFTYFLKNYAAFGIFKIKEIELLRADVEDLVNDFKNSKNLFIKNRSIKVLNYFNEIIAENYVLTKECKSE